MEENDWRLIVNKIGEDQMALVRIGLVHFAQNVEWSPASFRLAYSSEGPGLLNTTSQVSRERTVEEYPMRSAGPVAPALFGQKSFQPRYPRFVRITASGISE